jgi:hypothetical protein
VHCHLDLTNSQLTAVVLFFGISNENIARAEVAPYQDPELGSTLIQIVNLTANSPSANVTVHNFPACRLLIQTFSDATTVTGTETYFILSPDAAQPIATIDDAGLVTLSESPVSKQVRAVNALLHGEDPAAALAQSPFTVDKGSIPLPGNFTVSDDGTPMHTFDCSPVMDGGRVKLCIWVHRSSGDGVTPYRMNPGSKCHLQLAWRLNGLLGD